MPRLAEFHQVAKVGDLEDGTMKSVTADRHMYLLARIGDEYFCLDDWCTHADAQLDQGFIHADAYEIECPLHEGHFDLRTGNPTVPPPEDPVDSYAVRIEGDDILIGPKDEV